MVEERDGKNDQGKAYKYNVLIRDGEEYRIANVVIEMIQGILLANQKHGKEVKTFSVEKTGEGKNTKYQVITLDE